MRAEAKIRQFKADLSRNRTEAKTMSTSLDRADLLGGGAKSSTHYSDDPSSAEQGGTNDGFAQSQAQRARLLSGTDKLADGQRRLEESHRLALETEDLGAGILGNLRGQREQIEGTRDRLYQADSSIDKASGTLGQMIRRFVGLLFPSLYLCAPSLCFVLIRLWVLTIIS